MGALGAFGLVTGMVLATTALPAAAITSTTTTLTSPTMNPSFVGQQVDLHAVVTGSTPTGTVTFNGLPAGDSCNESGNNTVTMSAGAADCDFAFQSANTSGYNITAMYNGDNNNSSSVSNTVVQVVQKMGTATSPATTGPFSPCEMLNGSFTPCTSSNVFSGQNVDFIVEVNPATTYSQLSGPPPPAQPAPDSTVTFTLNNGASCSNPGGNTQTPFEDIGTTSYYFCAVLDLLAANTPYTFSATYSGDNNYLSSASSNPAFSQIVNKANTSDALTSGGPSTSVVGQAVSFTQSVSNTSPLSVTPPAVTGTVTFSGLPSGVFCNGGANSSSNTITLNGSGQATCTVTSKAAGTYNIGSVFNANSNYNGSTSSPATITETVNQAGSLSSLSISPTTGTPGGTETLTDTVSPSPVFAGSPTPTGNVTFTNNGNPVTCQQTATDVVSLSSGQAQCTFTLPGNASGTLGPYQGVYAGDSHYTGSTSNGVFLPIALTNTVTSLSINPNPGVPGNTEVLKAKVTPTGVTGNVTFTNNGSAVVCSETGSDVVALGPNSHHPSLAANVAECTFTLSHSASGTEGPFQAVYAGDAHHATSTSNGVFLTIQSGPATKLHFDTQPPTGRAPGTIFTIKVAVEDSFGNVVTTSSAPVTLTLQGGPTNAVLTCTPSNTTNAVNGIATFSCYVNRAGSGYSIRATSAGLSGATSNKFSVILK